MTITDNGRVEVDEDTLARARELITDGRMPSKRELRAHLGKRWEVAGAVLTRLGEEAEQRRQEKRQRMRATMRRLTSRKRPGSVRLVVSDRQRTVNEITSPTAAEEHLPPDAGGTPLTVGKHPVPTVETVNQMPAPAMSAWQIGPALPTVDRPKRRPRSWPIAVLTFPAFVAVWGGWVDMGRLTGYGVVHPFPGIPGLDRVAMNMAITLPVSVEVYAAYALYVWLSTWVPAKARAFAKWSAIGSLVLGALGQVAYHLMVAAGITVAPWQITTVVACLPVAVLGMGAALRHLVHTEEPRRLPAAASDESEEAAR